MTVEFGKHLQELSVEEISNFVDNKSDVTLGVNTEKKRLPTKKGSQWQSKKSKDELADTSDNKAFSAAELMVERSKRIELYKASMAHSSKNIVSYPQYVSCYNRLLIFLADNNPLTAITVRKYAALCLLDVFLQIIPNYKINETAHIKKKMSPAEKDEQVIIQFYLRYIKQMQKILDETVTMKANPAIDSLEKTLVTCFCTIVEKCPKFNFKEDIIEFMIKYLNYARPSSSLVYETLKNILAADSRGDESLKIVKLLYAFLIKNQVKSDERVLNVFLHVNLEHLENKSVNPKDLKKDLNKQQLLMKKITKKQKTFLSKKQKRNRKKQSMLQNKINEINKNIIKENLAIRHSEILELMLGIYFLILKRKPETSTISSVFEGLARVAHLINIKFFTDLLKVLDEYFIEETLSISDLLFCIQTVFTILMCQQEALTIDPYPFYCHLYNILPKLVYECEDKNLGTLQKIFEQLFKGKRNNKISNPRLCAFLKRLSALSLQLPKASSTTAIMEIIVSFIKMNSSTEVLLDTTEGGCFGDFIIDGNEPDTSNSEDSTLWESYLHIRSYDTKIATEANSYFKINQLTR